MYIYCYKDYYGLLLKKEYWLILQMLEWEINSKGIIYIPIPTVTYSILFLNKFATPKNNN